MKDLLRDTIFSHTLRLMTGGKVFKYPEEEDSKLWKKYVHTEKSANMARHGQTEPPEDNERQGRGAQTRHSSSSSTVVPSRRSEGVNEPSGVPVDKEKGKDIHVVDWYGPDDPENPRNWSRMKRFFVTFEICLLTFSVYIGSAIYSAGLQSVMQEFGVSQVAATLGLTVFVAGYGLGPMIWSPLSEVPQIGRNPVYILTLALFVVLQVPTALATNFGMLLAFRFLTGFIGSPSLATGGASIGDMYRPSKRTYGIAIWGVGNICGPTLGPLVGGFAAEAKGWRWTIWELMWLSGFSLLFFIFFLPETSSANILYRRSRRLRKLTGNDKLICEAELANQDMSMKDMALMTLIRPFQLSLGEPIVLILNLYIALIYGLLYIWFESFPIVFTELYGFSLGITGLAYLGILCGVFVVLPPFVWYQHKYIEPKFNDDGELKPEWRLPPSFVGAFCIPICLFWFGWSSRADIHWIVPIIGTSWFTIGAFLLFNSVLNYLGDAYPEYAASVLAGNDFFRSSFGAGFPLFATAMYTKLGVDWASSTLAFISIAFIPVPFLLFNVVKGTSSNAFWKSKVLSEMAWAVEFFPSIEYLGKFQPDWFKVYKVLRAISKSQVTRQPLVTHGLQNRYRIWGVCERLIKANRIHHDAIKEAFIDKSVPILGATNAIFPNMGYPFEACIVANSISLLKSFEAVRNAQSWIIVSCSSGGALAGIGTRTTAKATQNCIGSRNLFANSTEFKMPLESWITESAMTSEDGGDERVVNPDPGNFVIGIKITFAAGKPVCKIALLFQPFSDAPKNSIPLSRPEELLDEFGAPYPVNNPETTGHLWKNGAPPKELQILTCRTGYITPDRSRDDSLSKILLFGTSESDLDKVCAIGVDAQFRGFVVRTDNDSTRTIGKANAMQYLSIDGRGGERILYCYVCLIDVVRGIRFVTNKGRQLVIGDVGGSREISFPSDEREFCRETLMGIYCHWGNRNTPGLNLDTVDAFTRKMARTLTKTPKMKTDGQGRYWTPCAPPKTTQVLGPIYGQRTEGRIEITGNRATLTWLDCSKPISSVTVMLCHGTNTEQLPLVSVSLNYADQTTASFGPTELDPPKDSRGLKGRYWCMCFEGSRHKDGEEEQEEKPHYTQEQWNVEGACLENAHLWIDDKGCLTGLQFTAQDGKESPASGYCVGSKTKLSLRTGSKNRAAGLKFWIDTIGRGVTREDLVVKAIQLMELRV
ncbi:MFS DHA1 multidrug resistance [Fusarium heterosporum]|uniref:MFS DHA1 multidrug resistance n=1 Tax=Fusarium heterosporum TaxID=42747 RepID=A0A8H5WYC5_FUSHE|nr:MFS DHA1 multidrug resistance [Fusarium heterosporum]